MRHLAGPCVAAAVSARLGLAPTRAASVLGPWVLVTVLLFSAFFCALFAGAARAQSPEALQAAAAAFREGQAAQLTGDHARAAELFEVADGTAPSPAALRSAIRSHRAAGHAARAGTLALEALRRYPDDAETGALARETIAAVTPSVARLEVRCELPCSVSFDHRVNGAAAEASEVFLDAGDHTVMASWSGHPSVTERLVVSAGETRTLVLIAPPAEVAVTEPDPEPEPEPTPPGDEDRPGGISPAVFGVMAGLTVVAAGISIGSGVDVLAARDAYVAMPTEAGYRDGIDRETRTNVFIGATAVLGAAALVTTLFTDFGGGAVLTSFVVPTEDGAVGVVSGRF